MRLARRPSGFVAALSFVLAAWGPCASAAGPRPNVILLIGEGQGWNSLSAPMDDRVPGSKSTLNHTPNLDRLALGGMRFANFYAASPRCTPSRAALFTGKSPAQLHMTFVGEGRNDQGGGPGTKIVPPRASTEMPRSETTIAEVLKQSGYATAHFGKWHVGRTDPSAHGYDESDGPTSNGGPENVANPNPKQAYASARRGVDFMTRAVKAGKPFYLQVAQYAGKDEADATPETFAAVQKRLGGRDANRAGAAAVAEDADVTYGMLMKALDDLGVTGETYVIYTTDHGTPGRNTPLSGGKGMISDGGLRVPLLIKGPGVKAGAVSRVRTTGVDLFPTIAELAGVAVSKLKELEGGSLVALLRQGGETPVKRPRDEFVVHFPHYDKDPLGPASAIYLGDDKLVRLYETNERRLFDLSRDPAERTDLARRSPAKAAELDRRLTEYLKTVGAQMPTLNPNPDPSKAASTLPGDRRGGRREGAMRKNAGKAAAGRQPTRDCVP
ncbi:MAG: sulfatase-like hydrolase/transferase [Isosphaeraceae bacterium]